MTYLTDIHLSTPQVSFAELCHCANLSAEYMRELIDYDIITPIAGQRQQEWQFNLAAISLVHKAARLHRDLEIDWADIALLLSLLEEITQLRHENSQLKQRLKRFSS